jgi:hypothetical protein
MTDADSFASVIEINRAKLAEDAGRMPKCHDTEPNIGGLHLAERLIARSSAE